VNIEEITEIKSLIANNMVTMRKHPHMDLWILNYTPRMQFESAWTPVAEQCRGLIIDADYNVVERPFPKFFNLGERMQISDLPDSMPVITEKLDGFLGILYDENGLPAIATRGAFDSPMATFATNWIRSKGYTMSDFRGDYTYLFEIIDPVLCRDQGLLVDYGNRSECVLIAVRNTMTGQEISHIDEAERIGLPFAKEYTGTLEDAITELPTMKGTEQEGFVCRWSNGLHIKLKGDHYKKLHRMLSGLAPKRVLSTLIESGHAGIDEMIEGIPDESFDRVHAIVDAIEAKQKWFIDQGRIVYNMAKDLPTRKEQAEVIARSPHKAVAFAMLKGGDYNAIALKQVRNVLKEIDGFK